MDALPRRPGVAGPRRLLDRNENIAIVLKTGTAYGPGMRLVGREKLAAFQKRWPEVRSWIESWTAEVTRVTWKRPQDIKKRFPSASVISKGVIVFNVKGNKFRLQIHVAYETEVVSVVRWGTHSEYNHWNLKEQR